MTWSLEAESRYQVSLWIVDVVEKVAAITGISCARLTEVAAVITPSGCSGCSSGVVSAFLFNARSFTSLRMRISFLFFLIVASIFY